MTEAVGNNVKTYSLKQKGWGAVGSVINEELITLPSKVTQQSSIDLNELLDFN
nr:hypothetical protein [Providencia rettgeri]